MLQALRIRNLSSRPTRTYISLVSRFALFFHCSPDSLGLPEIERHLFFLRDEKKVSYCLFKQTVAALRFFYLHVMNRPDLVVRIPYGREWWRQTMRGTRPTGLLFPCARDPLRPLDPSTVQRALRIAVGRAGLTKRVSPRTQRVL